MPKTHEGVGLKAHEGVGLKAHETKGKREKPSLPRPKNQEGAQWWELDRDT